MTGKPPELRALTANTTMFSGPGFNDAWVDLTALGWVSRETVDRLYHQAQQRLLIGRGVPGSRALDVFRFVTREAGAHVSNGDERWPALFDKWHTEHPDDSTIRNRAGLRQYYNRAKKSLLSHNHWKSWQQGQKLAQSSKNGDSDVRTWAGCQILS